MKGTLAYYPRIENINAADEWAKERRGDYMLFGEYGISPLVMKIAGSISPSPMMEIVLSNKNRELFTASLRSAHAAGFSGAVITSGRFEKKDDMPMPVFDLDTTQALTIAVEAKKNGSLPDFLIGVRAASGSEPSELRARHFLDLGADFIVLSNKNSIKGLESRTVICEEYTQR